MTTGTSLPPAGQHVPPPPAPYPYHQMADEGRPYGEGVCHAVKWGIGPLTCSTGQDYKPAMQRFQRDKSFECCGMFVHYVKIYCCDWFDKGLTNRERGRRRGRNFQAETEEVGEESRCKSDVNKTWRESDLQNERKVKSQEAKCRLININGLSSKN